MTSLEFFALHDGNKEMCKVLQGMPITQVIAWEADAVTKYSPGPINDNESLCRQILSPLHYDIATKQLKVSALGDVAGKGLSVNRLAHTTLDATARAGTSRVEINNTRLTENGKETNKFWGFATFKASEIRSITSQLNHENVRGFAIYDTATNEDKSHADVCQIIDKACGRSVRSKLVDLANKSLRQF